MRYDLKAELGGIEIRIPYPNAGSYTVWANGVEIPYTPWDEAAGRHAPLTQAQGCGENRFVGVENFLDFYLTPGCAIEIKPRDAIMTSVRLDWTLDEFYAEQGVTRFSDRVAAALGIHRSRVHVVAVYVGSVIVDFFISAEWDDEEPETTLLAIKNDLMNQIVATTLDLGAPILGAAMDGVVVVGACYQNCDEDADGDDDLWSDYVDDSESEEDDEGADGNAPSQKDTVTIQVSVSRDQASILGNPKYPIILLAVLAAVLTLIVVVILSRMCCAKTAVTKSETVLRKLDTLQPDQQYHLKADDEKNVFVGKRSKKQASKTAD